MSTITETLSHYELATRQPADTVVLCHGVTWEEYESLLEQVGETSGRRISYDNGVLQVMTLSDEHERYVRFIESLVSQIRFRLQINILSFGSATMKNPRIKKGTEPDATFYIQHAAAIGTRRQRDLQADPPPDVIVEVDLHHDSLAKFSIFAGLGIPEIWRYDGKELTIHLRQGDRYRATEQSQALPMLTGQSLTTFLARLPQDGELQTILAFDEWLQAAEESKRQK